MITKDELYNLYVEQKKTQTEIGKMYGCDRKNIDYYLKKYKIPKRSRKESQHAIRKTDLTGYDIKRMVDEGKLIKDIAEEYNITRSIISSRLKECGINLRNHKAARKHQSDFMKKNNPLNDTEVKTKVLKQLKEYNQNFSKEYMRKNKRFDNDLDFRAYAKKARHLAYRHYKKGKEIPNGMVIDHKYSIKDGYKNKVPLSIISHSYNLQLITNDENLKKAFKSVITLQELYNGAVFND